MLTPSKKRKLLSALRSYQKKFISKDYKNLDESATRLMINSLLTDVLGFASIDEIKTEYMIKHSYADYVIQTKKNRHFLIEVKAFDIPLSEKHLKQAVHYGADEGIEWALLTNGHTFELYRILFEKPIDKRKVFSIDLTDSSKLAEAVDYLQYLHRECVDQKGMEKLWHKYNALHPSSVAGLFYAPQVVNFLKRNLKKKYRANFTEGEVRVAISKIILEEIQLDGIKPVRKQRKKKKLSRITTTNTQPTSVA